MLKAKQNAYQCYLVITGAHYHWGLGTLHFPSSSLGSCRGQTQGRHGQFPSREHLVGTLSGWESDRHLGSPEVNSLHCSSQYTRKCERANGFVKSVALTRGPAGCSGQLGTHLVARSTVPVITKAVSHHHVVLRVRQATRHLHWSDGTC